MNKLSRYLISLGLIFIFLLAFGFIVVLREQQGHKTPGPFGFIILVGLIAALKTVWKYKFNKKNDDENNNPPNNSLNVDKYKLDKS